MTSTQNEKIKSMEKMALGLAHDFTSILGLIIGRTSLLEKALQKESSPLLSHINSIKIAARSGCTLIDQVLAFADPEKLILEWTDINSLLLEAIQTLRNDTERNITLTLHLEPDLAPTLIDQRYIRKVIQNLYSNAEKAIPSGGEMTIRSGTLTGEAVKKKWPTSSDNTYFWLSVTDSGELIDPLELVRVFEPFFTSKGRGLHTLELSVVHGYVWIHQGYVEVCSKQGAGTTFYVYLPLSGPNLQNEDS